MHTSIHTPPPLTPNMDDVGVSGRGRFSCFLLGPLIGLHNAGVGPWDDTK